MEQPVHKHCNRELSNNHLLLTLQEYMITNEKINSLSNRHHKDIKMHKKKEKINNNNNIYYSKYQDQLFWLFYIIKFGYMEYEQVGNHNFSIEKEKKISAIEYIRKEPHILKEKKLKRNNIESDLLNSKQIDINTLYALCLYNDINIIYVKNKCYYELFSNTPGPNALIKQYGKIISCELEISNNMVEMIKNKYYLIENIDKPIKGISSYKISELAAIGKFFDIKLTYESGKNKTKKDIYEEIRKFV